MRTRLSVLTASLLLIPMSLAAESVLVFEEPWTPLAPPGRTMAGFVTIHNTSEDPVVLVRGESPVFGRIEIHTMTMDDGVMRMRRLEELAIEPGGQVALQRGGLHLMLFEPQTQFRAGEHLEIVLEDAEGGRHELELEVRER